MLTSHFTEQTSKNPVCSLNLTHFTMTMHATIHFSPCNIMRLASTHMINRVKTTCRKEEHHCESATERGRSGFGSCSVTSPFSARLKTQSFSAARSPAVKRVTSTFCWQCHQAAALHLQLHSVCLLLCLLLSSLLLSASATQGNSSPSTSLSPNSKATLAASWEKKKNLRFMSSPGYWSHRLHLQKTPLEAGPHLLKKSRIMHIANGSRLVYI